MTVDLTKLLRAAQAGDVDAVDQVFEATYHELHELAHARLSGRRAGGTLNTTALVHETYLKLCDQRALDVQSRAHFFALSARAMRQIIIDHFRKFAAQKRGGAYAPLRLDTNDIAIENRGETLLALDEALTRLSALDERLGLVVEYRFFGGMTEMEIATMLGVTDRTVRNLWTKAKAWLSIELQTEP